MGDGVEFVDSDHKLHDRLPPAGFAERAFAPFFEITPHCDKVDHAVAMSRRKRLPLNLKRTVFRREYRSDIMGRAVAVALSTRMMSLSSWARTLAGMPLSADSCVAVAGVFLGGAVFSASDAGGVAETVKDCFASGASCASDSVLFGLRSACRCPALPALASCCRQPRRPRNPDLANGRRDREERNQYCLGRTHRRAVGAAHGGIARWSRCEGDPLPRVLGDHEALFHGRGGCVFFIDRLFRWRAGDWR